MVEKPFLILDRIGVIYVTLTKTHSQKMNWNCRGEEIGNHIKGMLGTQNTSVVPLLLLLV